MKRIVCISTILSPSNDPSVSSQVIDIFNSTRSFNTDHHITGVFLVASNLLLQVIEGDPTILGNIVFKMRHDQRMEDFNVIHNSNVENSEFASWGIKVIRSDAEGHHNVVDKLRRLLDGQLELKNQLDEQRVKAFLEPKVSLAVNPSPRIKSLASGSLGEEVELQKSILSLSSWPKPGQIKLNPDLIRICARMVRRPLHYNDLKNAGIISNPDALDSYLQELDRLNLLKKHQDSRRPTLKGIDGGAQSPRSGRGADRFGQKLRHFLATSRL